MTKPIWAPWRMAFIAKAHKQRGGCVFCEQPKKGIKASTLVIYQGAHSFVILNKYPYTCGHLMVVPNRHTNLFEDLTAEEHCEMSALVAASIKILKKAAGAQGFNVGLNLGKAAGAGIKDHLHYHVIPRWEGDNNIMPVIGNIRVMPEHLNDTYKKLAPHFKKLKK
ncbi:HIT domain-containing protein [bacterium]|nr:HIT domain-containing protein [bacterium]